MHLVTRITLISTHRSLLIHLLRRKETGSTIIVTYSYNTLLTIPAPNRLGCDAVAMRQFVGRQHALGSQACIPISKTMMPTKLGDMHAPKEQPVKGAIPLLIELLSDLGIGILIEQTIDGFQRRWCRQARLSKRWGKCNRDGLHCSSLEANMGDNLIGFVDRHIFNQQTKRSFALAYAGFRIIPELAKAFWDLCDLCTLLCVHLMLITLV